MNLEKVKDEVKAIKNNYNLINEEIRSREYSNFDRKKIPKWSRHTRNFWQLLRPLVNSINLALETLIEELENDEILSN